MQGYYIWDEDYYFGLLSKFCAFFSYSDWHNVIYPKLAMVFLLISIIPIAILLLVDRFYVLDCNLKPDILDQTPSP